MTNRRSVLTLVVALVVAGVVWWTQGDDGGPTSAVDPASTSAPSSSSSSPDGHRSAGSEASATTDPGSGLAWVDAGDLPPEAGDTLALIDAGGPFPYDQDDGTFGNFEGLLPDHDRGYYREYTVETPGSDDRGARRIITGDGGEYYWTADHYQSFERIRR